jgi:hypothetical protein
VPRAPSRAVSPATRARDAAHGRATILLRLRAYAVRVGGADGLADRALQGNNIEFRGFFYANMNYTILDDAKVGALPRTPGQRLCSASRPVPRLSSASA